MTTAYVPSVQIQAYGGVRWQVRLDCDCKQGVPFVRFGFHSEQAARDAAPRHEEAHFTRWHQGGVG